MTNLVFFFIATLTFMILQSVVIPGFSWFPHCFDLMIINVLYLSLFSIRYWVMITLVLIGVIMDSLSGGPFFLHTTSYLCIYLIVFLLRQLVFQHSTAFVLVVSLAAALIHQGLVLFSIFLIQGYQGIATADFSLAAGQIIWAVVGIPAGVWLLGVFHHNFSYAVKISRRQLAGRYRG